MRRDVPDGLRHAPEHPLGSARLLHTGLPWLGIAVFALLVVLVVPMADDWYHACLARDLGWWPALVQRYTRWTGLWLADVCHLGLPALVNPFLSAWLACGLAFLGLWAALKHLRRSLDPAGSRLTHWTEAAALLGLFLGTGYPREGVYWGTTACSYAAGWACATWACSLCWRWSRQEHGWGRRLAIFGIGLLIPGWCETIVPVCLGGALIGWLLGQERGGRSLWFALVAGVLAGCLPVVLASGNYARMQTSGGPYPLPDALRLAWAACWQVPLQYGVLILGCLTTVFLAMRPERAPEPIPMRILVLVAATTVAAACAAGVPSAVATNEINLRVRDTGWWLTLLMLAWTAPRLAAWFQTARHPHWWGIGCGLGAVLVLLVPIADPVLPALGLGILGVALLVGHRPDWRQRLAGVAMAACFAVATWAAFPDLFHRGPLRSLTWLERHRQLSQAAERGEQVAVVARLPNDAYPQLLMHSDIAPNPREVWVQHIARWYRLEAIWLEPPDDLSPRQREQWLRAIERDRERASGNR